MKLCISSRHELRLITLDNVLIIEADGNYSSFVFVDGTHRSELSCISVFEKNIEILYSDECKINPFCRLGRSLLINTDFVKSINLRTGRLVFSSDAVPFMILSHRLLKRLKVFIDKKYGLAKEE